MSGPFQLPGREDLEAMVRLALPVVVVQVGIMLMGVVDTMVVGRLSAEALAAVALGNLAVMSVYAFGLGMLMSIDPLVSQALGARDTLAVRRTVQRGLLIAVIITVPSVLVLLPIEPVLHVLHQPAQTVPIAAGYVHRCLPGLLPFFGFFVLRQTLQAMEKVRPIIITIVGANVLNVLLDLAMVHGLWGVPALGAMGSAWATTVSRTVLFVGLVVIARGRLLPLISVFDRESLRAAPLARMMALGAPIGLQVQLEFAAFGIIALLMGGLGTLEMAAHQVTINLASLTFMVPLGVSAAAAVKVGRAVGRGDDQGVRRAASAALICGAGFMCVTAALFILIPEVLAAAYTGDRAVRALAVILIPIAGVFQVVDGVQVVSSGVLRGLGDTKAPMVINVLGFWLLGMPVSLGLGLFLDLGPPGLWWGLVVGLSSVAALLLLRVSQRLSRPVERLHLG